MTWSWDNLFEGYKKGTITYKQGNLYRRDVPGIFESLVCMCGVPCATDLIDNYFCYVYHVEERKFASWGPNTVLKLLPTRETQDEILHLRAQVSTLKAMVTNFTTTP